jgi:exonuclease V gamma subunit
MTLKVIESNRIETLFSALTSRLKQNKQGILHPHQMVITCFGVEQWLLKTLTNEFGVFINGKFDFPINFVHKLGKILTLDSDDFYHSKVLSFRLFSLLHHSDIRQQIATIAPQFFTYLYCDNPSLSEQRLLQTSNILSNIFDEYQWQRPEWLECWQDNKIVKLPPFLKSTQSIQALLWRALLAQEHPKNDFLQRHQLVKKIINALAQEVKDIKGVQQTFQNGISVFAVLPLMPPIWQIFQALGKRVEVDFYFLNPSMELWGENLYLPLWEEKAKEMHTQQNIEDDGLFYQHHPLLMSLGQVGAECQKQILDAVDIQIDSCFIETNERDNLNLLEALQRNILYDIPQAEASPLVIGSEDTSLQVHCFPNGQSELKFLHNQILLWLQQDESRTLSDILVVAPNLEIYQEWIPIIFSDIPHSSYAVKSNDSLYEAFDFLLQLFTDEKPLGMDELRYFFAFSCVQEKLKNQVSLEQIEEFLNSLYCLGFRWGITDLQREKQGFESGLSLQGALDLMSVEMCSKETIALVDWASCMSLQEYLKQLINAYQKIHHPNQSVPKNIASWIEYLISWIDVFFINDERSATYQQQSEGLITRLRKIENDAVFAESQELFSISSMRSIWRSYQSQNIHQSNYLSGKLMFSQLLDVRCVPCKFIAIIGLDENYNRRNSEHSMDLTWHLPKPYDRSAEANNNYYILEYIQSAREKLWLSYSADANQHLSNSANSLNAIIEYIQRNRAGHSVGEFLFEHSDSYILSEATPPLENSLPLQEDIGILPDKHVKDLSQSHLLLSCSQLAAKLIDPIKTFIISSGGQVVKQSPIDNRYEDSMLDPLNRADWRVKILSSLLTESEQEFQNTRQILIAELAQDNRFLSAEIIAQELNKQCKKIQTDIEKGALINSSLQAPKKPFIYRTKYENQQYTLSSQPRLVGETEDGVIQVFISGGKQNLQKLLQAWLGHTLCNTQQKTSTYYLCFKQSSDSFTIIEQSMPTIAPQQAKQKINALIELYFEVQKKCVWAPPNMTFCMANASDLQQEIKEIKKTFYELDEKSEWLSLLNDYRLYDLSEGEKTWEDSRTYASNLWGGNR